MVNFTSILNKKLSTIEKPPLLPIGTYIWAVDKIPETNSFTARESGVFYETLTFMMRCVEATEDVDPDDLESYGNLSRVKRRKQFLFDTSDEQAFKRSLFNLTTFIERHLAVDGAAKMELNEALNSTIEHQCLGVVQWRPNPKDAENPFDEISRTAPIG